MSKLFVLIQKQLDFQKTKVGGHFFFNMLGVGVSGGSSSSRSLNNPAAVYKPNTQPQSK